MTPSGTVTEYPIPTSSSVPQGITKRPDGNLWLTEYLGNKIGKITPSGAITEYSIPTGSAGPTAITTGPDSNLWFTEMDANKIGQITPTGAITEYSIPTTSSNPRVITTGPDGNLWFTEESGNKIGAMTPSGTFTEYPIPTSGSDPTDITTGPDGNLWLTEFTGNKIGRVNLTSPSPTLTPMPPPGTELFHVKARKNYGLLAHAVRMIGSLGIYKPTVPNQISTWSITQINGMTSDQLTALEVGWAVDPYEYKNSDPHLFIFTRYYVGVTKKTARSCSMLEIGCALMNMATMKHPTFIPYLTHLFYPTGILSHSKIRRNKSL